jgi:hypothetical protein
MLGICFVDGFANGGGDPKTCAAQCVADVAQRARRASFRDYVAKNRFEMAIITSTRERAAALRTALKAHELPTGMRTVIGVVPRMINMIPHPTVPIVGKRGSGPRALSSLASSDGHRNGHHEVVAAKPGGRRRL